MKKKDHSQMRFGELMVASSAQAAEIAMGKLTPAKVSRVTARHADVASPPAYGAQRVKAVREHLGLPQPGLPGR